MNGEREKKRTKKRGGKISKEGGEGAFSEGPAREHFLIEGAQRLWGKGESQEVGGTKKNQIEVILNVWNPSLKKKKRGLGKKKR